MCGNTVLQKSSTNTSCCSIIPVEMGNIMQVITWCMTVAKTYPRILSPTCCSLSKWQANLRVYSDSNFAISKTCNREIECLQKYLLIAHFTKHCHRFTFASFIVLSGGWTIQILHMVSWVWLRRKRCQWKYASNLCFCSGNFYISKFHLNSVMCHSHLSPTERWKPVPASRDSCFVLCEINIY